MTYGRKENGAPFRSAVYFSLILRVKFGAEPDFSAPQAGKVPSPRFAQSAKLHRASGANSPSGELRAGGQRRGTGGKGALIRLAVN